MILKRFLLRFDRVTNFHEFSEYFGKAVVHFFENLLYWLEKFMLKKLLATEEYLHTSHIIFPQRRDGFHAVIYAFLDVDELELQNIVFVLGDLWKFIYIESIHHRNYNIDEEKRIK